MPSFVGVISASAFTTLWANSADDKLVMFFLFAPENRFWDFMQIVSMKFQNLFSGKN